MPKDLTLESLDKSLEQSKSEELERVKKIEQKSMEELAQSLKTSLQTELSSIEEDMTTRLNTLRTKMSEARKKIIEDENETLKTLRINRKTIESESQSLMQSLNKIKIRYWLVPSLIGLSLVLGFTIGSYFLGGYVDNELQDLQTVRAEVAKAEQIKKSLEPFTPVNKIYKNGIEVKKGYKIEAWKADNGLWFAEIKKGR